MVNMKNIFKKSEKSEKKKNDGDENVERGNWSGKLDFILSVVGYAVGLGNVWRFPYRTYQNGGASFLIPYIIILVLAGLPLFYLEMALGQFSSLGPVSVWKISPAFTGIGWAMVIISTLTAIYYNMIIAYIIYYLFASFTSVLPWQNCREEWIQYGCYERMSPNATAELNMTRQWCMSLENMNLTNLTEIEGYTGNCTVKPKTPSEIYWERVVLDISTGVDDGVSDIKWDLALCLLLAWIVCAACLIKGVKSSGKVVYFTAVFPYVVLVILLIWNAQLEGAWRGIKYYLVPQWERLGNAEVWYAAGSQIFFSLGVAFGGLETMASYNKFHNNIYRDALLVSLINCGTSIFAGFVIFAAIGHMAEKSNLDVDEVAAGGPGLTFIVYPEGLALMPVAPLWSILFFLMFFTLGLDSQFGMMEAVITSVVDVFPALKIGYRKMIFIIILSCALFLCGLPQCSRAGIYIMTLFDWYSAGLNLMLVAMFEIAAVVWVYGFKRFSEDISLMIGSKPNYYWIVSWLVLSPLMVIFIFIFSIVQTTGASYGSYEFPEWANGIGWSFAGVSIGIIPIYGLVIFCLNRKKSSSLRQAIRKTFHHTKDWGPALPQHRTGRYSNMEFDNMEAINGLDKPPTDKSQQNNGYVPSADETQHDNGYNPPKDESHKNTGYVADQDDTRF